MQADQSSFAKRTVTLPARPGPLAFRNDQAAVLVVDMQNDFGAQGGMFHRAGIDISMIQRAVGPTRRVIAAARRIGMPVVYLKMAFQPDLSDAGPPDSPNFLRHSRLGVGSTITAPDGRSSRILIRDTWNTEILPELAPLEGDPVITKNRFSGFFETELHSVLTSGGIKQLIVTGCTTSICVESTIRDAMFRDYCCALLEDCTAEPIGAGLPRSNHEASLLTIEMLLGWVSTSEQFLQAIIDLETPLPTALAYG